MQRTVQHYTYPGHRSLWGTKIGDEKITREGQLTFSFCRETTNVLFRRRFQERRDATRRREDASPKKSIILLVSQARAGESAREIFLAMTEVYQARLSHVGSPAGASAVCARSNYILLCLSTTHLSTRTRCSFSSPSFSPFLLLLPFSRAALPLARAAPPRRVLQAPPATIGRAPNRTRSLVKSSRDLRKFPVPPDGLSVACGRAPAMWSRTCPRWEVLL